MKSYPIMSGPTRRNVVAGIAATGMLTVAGAPARAAESDFPLTTEKGEPLANFRLPSELTTDKLPGVLWAGASNPDVTLIEFFDYNCPFCRLAARDIDALVGRNSDLQLGIVNNAIISIGSAQAAKVHLAVLKLYGPATAHQFHLRLLDRRGQTDGLVALQLAETMKLDRKDIETAGNSPAIGDALRAQYALATSLGFNATPSFMIDGVGILGYPGPKSTQAIVAAVRTCDKVVCR